MDNIEIEEEEIKVEIINNVIHEEARLMCDAAQDNKIFHSKDALRLSIKLMD